MAGLITLIILLPLLGASLGQRNPAELCAGGRSWVHSVERRCGLTFVAQLRRAPRPDCSSSSGIPWIPSIGAEYLLGVDGLSLLLVILTSLIFPFALLAGRMSRGACALLLVMQAALYGTFTAQNFILWFLFYEMSLVPGFLLIKIWGGENRDRAATKFFLYTFLGSVAMLLSFLGNISREREFRIREVNRTRAKRAAAHREARLVRLRRNLPRPRCKGAALPVSHLAPGRLRNGTDRRLNGVDGRPLEDGRLRICPAPASAFPTRDSVARSLAPGPRGLLDRLLFARGVGSIRSETNGRLSLYQPSRLLPSRVVRGQRERRSVRGRPSRGVQRSFSPNFQPRHYRRRLVLFCRPARGTERFPGHPRLWRLDATNAIALRLDERRHVLLPRPAGPEWLHRRVPHLQGRFQSRRDPQRPSRFSGCFSPPSPSCAPCSCCSAARFQPVAKHSPT